MRYRITPLNLFGIVLIGFAIFFAVEGTHNEEGFGIMLSLLMIPVIFVTFLADLIFQKTMRNFWKLCTAELILIGLFLLFLKFLHY